MMVFGCGNFSGISGICNCYNIVCNICWQWSEILERCEKYTIWGCWDLSNTHRKKLNDLSGVVWSQPYPNDSYWGNLPALNVILTMKTQHFMNGRGHLIVDDHFPHQRTWLVVSPTFHKPSGGFQLGKWGYPTRDGLFHGKSIYKWMRTRGTPMTQEISIWREKSLRINH